MLDCCNKYGDSLHAQEFQCPTRNINVRYVTNMATFQVYAIKEDSSTSQENSQKPQRTSTSCRPNIYSQDSSSHRHSEASSSNESFCLQLQIQSDHAKGKQIQNPVHLITNLAYQLKPHNTRNMYL